jgi:hypothetical protein
MLKYSILRTVGIFVSGLSTAASIIFDTVGVSQILGHTVKWQWFALGGFIIFAILMWWRGYELNQQNQQLQSRKSWIIDCETKTGRLPMLPESLLHLVKKYTLGHPISKNIELDLRPSLQAWNRLTPDNRERFLQILDWKGLDRFDFLQRLKDTAPPSGKTRQLHRKR